MHGRSGSWPGARKPHLELFAIGPSIEGADIKFIGSSNWSFVVSDVNLLRHTQLKSALQKIWFLGDVHGSFTHIEQALLAADIKPRWLVFLGDIDIHHMPFSQTLEPLRKSYPGIKVGFIHGNHDADTYDHWDCLHGAGEAVALHGQVVDLDGVKVASLGGTFLDRVWMPPKQPIFHSKSESMNRGPFQFRDGQRPNPAYLGAIYPDDFDQLAEQRADILITHEAPGCHPFGFQKIDELARSLGVLRSFHGHTHDDLTDQYKTQWGELGFEAIGVNFCSIKNGLGDVIPHVSSGTN
ncbi:MPP_superfamily domain containing protein [Comamonadaceae bacterium]